MTVPAAPLPSKSGPDWPVLCVGTCTVAQSIGQFLVLRNLLDLTDSSNHSQQKWSLLTALSHPLRGHPTASLGTSFLITLVFGFLFSFFSFLLSHAASLMFEVSVGDKQACPPVPWLIPAMESIVAFVEVLLAAVLLSQRQRRTHSESLSSDDSST